MRRKFLFLILLPIFILALGSCDNKSNTTTPDTSTDINTDSNNSTNTEATDSTDSSTEGSTESTEGTEPESTRPEIVLEPYYSSLNMNLEGDAFLSDLSRIINSGAKIGNYDDAYKRLTYTDEDPNNKNNVVCFYTGVSYPKGTSGSNRKWNREHTWAKSHGFSSKGAKPHNDIHHLRATEMKINSTRGNMDFDDVENHSGTVKHDDYGNKWISNKCFEPRDAVKGDVARIIFYMATMYKDSYHLKISDSIPTSGSSLGRLSTLLEWHQNDPVDNIERTRHERIYGFQNNRNPYIDHPEFVINAFGYDYQF